MGVDLIIHIINTIALHLVNARFGDFYGGVFHLLSTVQYMLPLIALALWMGQQSINQARWSFLCFLLAICFGAFIGTYFNENAAYEIIAIALIVLIGIPVTLKWRASFAIIITASALTGLFLGIANGSAWVNGMLRINFASGIIIMASLILLFTTAVVLSLTAKWHELAVRVMGSWIAAIGILHVPYIIQNNNLLIN